MPEGDIHMERGGPEGATVIFNLYAPDGRLTDMLDEQGNQRIKEVPLAGGKHAQCIHTVMQPMWPELCRAI